MITYIVGNPGSGKSYFAVYKLWYIFIYKPKPAKGLLGKIFKPKLPENKYLYAYTNINEFKFELDERLLKFDYDEVYSNLAKLYNAYKIEKKTDKELIELAKEMRLYKVLFVVDEIHNYFKAKEDPVLVWWVTYHRHLYQDLYFITQDLSLVNNEYKRVAEKFYRAIDSSKRLFSKRFKYAYFTSYKMYQSDRVNNFNINLPFNQEVFNLYHSGQDSKSKSVVKFFMVAGLIITLITILSFIYVLNTTFAVPDEYATTPSENLSPQISSVPATSSRVSKPAYLVKPDDDPLESVYIYEIVCVADSCRFKGGSGSFPYTYVFLLFQAINPLIFILLRKISIMLNITSFSDLRCLMLSSLLQFKNLIKVLFMKTLKKLLVIILCLSSFVKAETIYTDLLNFAELASKFNNIAIVTDDSIDDNYYYFIYQHDTNLTLSMFRKMLESKGLFLYKKDNFYYITDKKLPDYDLRRIDLSNYIVDDVRRIMANFELNATYSTTSNSVFFRVDDVAYEQIKQAVASIDKPLEQVEFKLTITETNLKDIKDRGAKLQSLLKPLNHGDLAYYINLITSPYTTNSNVVRNDSEGFFGVLNFLDTNGLTKIISSPFLTAKNHTEVNFSAVQNIPYLVQNSQTSATQTTTQNSYEYKDVGLKITLKPVILKDHVDFDLHLILEDLLSSSNTLTPITSKKELKSSYSLKRGDILVLSGINKTTTQKQRNGIPILKDIFILKYLFSVEQDHDINSVVTLTIQVI